MKHSIKRVQSQAGLSFAERKNVRPSVKQKLLFLLVLLLTATTGAWAQGTVTIKEGTADADKWTVKTGTTTVVLGKTVVAKDAPVTATYSGNKHVKSVTAVLKPAAEGHALSASVVGEVVGTDGLAYAVADKNNLPAGVTAAGMVAYKSGSNGLVIALSDDGSMDWNMANGASGAPAHKPAVTGQAWKLPSQDEWNQMFSANGGNEASYTGLNTAITNAGGSALDEYSEYWSFTEESSGSTAYSVYLNGGNTTWWKSNENQTLTVRACLAF